MRQSRGLAGQSVLLVEDEPRLGEMLIQGVREMGFQPAGAGSAEQALRILERQAFSVVVVDLNLPGASGLELLHAARGRWPHMQAIILTGFGDLESARQAIHLDVVDFLTKPCALGDLEIALGRAFRRLQQLEGPIDARYADAAKVEHEERASTAAETQPASSPAFKPRDASQALSMEEVERRTILATLQKHGGNRAATAAELGISVRTLYYRLGDYHKKGLIE